MEPVSLLLAGGAIVLYADYLTKKKRDQESDILPTLPGAMAAPQIGDASSIQVVAVHIRRARLVPQLGGEKLKVRVKYGQPGASIQCDTEELVAALPSRPAAADFVARVGEGQTQEQKLAIVDYNMTCLFLASGESESVIRLRLMRTGPLGYCSWAVGKAELRVPLRSQWRAQYAAGTHERELLIKGTSADIVFGSLDVAVETCVVEKGRLREHLQILDAQRCKQAFLVGVTPVIDGLVVDGSSEEHEQSVQQGQPVSSALGSASQVSAA